MNSAKRIAALLALLMIFALVPSEAFAVDVHPGMEKAPELAAEGLRGNVPLTEENFPCAVVLAAVSAHDGDGDGALSQTEIEQITELDVSNKGAALTSLDGIEYLTALETLKATDGALTRVELGWYENIRHIELDRNLISSLKVGSCNSLQYLSCTYNPLQTLVLPWGSSLTKLFCYGSGLKALDLMSASSLRGAFLNLDGTERSDGDTTYLDYTDTVVSLRVDKDTKIYTDPLIFHTTPADITAAEGERITLSVTSSDNTEAYQWEYCKPDSYEWIPVSDPSGKTASYTLTVAPRHNGYKYMCVISNALYSAQPCYTVLTVVPKPVITAQPNDVSVAVGAKASFSVTATGATGYQWWYLKPGAGTWTKVSSSGTAATYTLTTAERHNGYQYKCVVSNTVTKEDGSKVTAERESSTAKLTVGAAAVPKISTDPKSVTVNVGEKATFKVAATGAESYQWQYRTSSSGSWTAVKRNGSLASYTLTTEARHNGYQYRCKVTNTAGSVFSKAATLTVNSGPVITSQPKSVTVNEGAKATFKVTATGAESYKWYYRTTSSGSWTAVKSNGTSSTLTVTTAARHNGYQYRCKVTKGENSVFSEPATLTLRLKPVITTQPTSVSVTAGRTATFKVVASGEGLSYQWYYQKPGTTTWVAVSSNGTSATYKLTTAVRHNGYKYKCVVTNAAGSVTSSIVKLTVK